MHPVVFHLEKHHFVNLVSWTRVIEWMLGIYWIARKKLFGFTIIYYYDCSMAVTLKIFLLILHRIKLLCIRSWIRNSVLKLKPPYCILVYHFGFRFTNWQKGLAAKLWMWSVILLVINFSQFLAFLYKMNEFRSWRWKKRFINDTPQLHSKKGFKIA